MRIQAIGFTVLFFCFVLAACTKEKEEPFDKEKMMSNLHEKVAPFYYKDFSEKASVLNQAVEVFAAELSSENLTAARAAWKKAIYAWNKAEIIAFGPVRDSYYGYAIDYWPVREAQILAVLDGTDPINEDYIENLGVSAKGLHTLEYLLFNPDIPDEQLLEAFRSERRRQYVKLISASVEQKATALSEAWGIFFSNGSYANNSFQEKVSMLANSLLLLEELVKTEKLHDPMGGVEGGAPQPKEAEAWRSVYSNELIMANLEAIEDLFTGTPNEKGFDDYLDYLKIKHQDNVLLSETIISQIEKVRQKAQALDEPLHEAVVTDVSKVKAIYEDVKYLIVLTKSDMFSALNVKPSFTDADGD